MVFIHNPYSSENSARLFTSIGSPGWIGFSSFFLWLILALSGKEKILKNKWFYILLFGIPLFLIYKQWTNFIFADFSKEYYGWKPLYSSSIWPFIYFFYYISFMAAGLYININLMKKGKNPILKRQAKIVFITVLITLVLGSITDVILPLMNIHVIPNIACALVLIWAFGVVYAMVKYKFLTITPALAASNIISTMFDSLILLNTRGEIISVNKAALNLLGYREEELKGLPVSTLFAEQNLRDDFIKNITKGENLKNKDYIFKTKQGQNVPVLFSSSVLRDEAGAAGGVVCAARDISDRKKLEAEVLKSKKLESVGILAGGIAHDFNNLLSVIMVNLSLVQDNMDSGEKAYSLLKKAKKISLEAAELARKFIPFASGVPLKRKEITLSAILKNARDSELSGTDISFDIDIPADLSSIYGDKAQLSQVMRNLLLNAVEAVPDGGRISVRAKNTTIKPESKLLLKQGRYVKILIKDNGSGIQQEYMEKIFDPYFSTKETITHKGMGWGLTLCYAIIKRHEGHITVESQKGEGTTVTLYLPVFR